MDNQDYLDQISASVRPVKPKKNVGNFLSSGYFKWGMIALAVLIVTIIIGAALSGKTTIGEKCIALKLRIDKTNEVITEYQPSVKSSLLRSLSASLKGIFTDTSSQLGTYIGDSTAKEAVEEEAGLARDALMNEFFEAKINGLLDRVYAHKMALEIYSVMSDEAGIFNSTGDEALKSLLTNSYNSLNNLYNEFNDFSETK